MTTLPKKVFPFGVCFLGLLVYLYLATRVPVSQAQVTTFLTPPYFGTKTVSTIFDHQYPTLYDRTPPDVPGGSMHRDGNTYPAPGPCAGYSGHAGVDYVMVYDYVLAAHSGQVVKAGWMRENDRRYGLGLMVEIQTTVNTGTYTSRYGHLSALTVQNNQPVVQQKVIGISGKTGHVEGVHGLHLHFEIHKRHTNDLFYPVNPYGWGSTNPDPWQNSNLPIGRPASVNLWQNAPAIGFTGGCPQQMYVSGTPLLPSNNPPLAPDLTNPVHRIIDDSDTNRFVQFGPSWQTVNNCGSQGQCYGGTYRWRVRASGDTYNSAYAQWRPRVHDLVVGTYDVYAYIPNQHANTVLAFYRIYHNNKVHWAGIDQSRFNKPGYSRTWAYLGRYDFDDGLNTFQAQQIVIYHDGDVAQEMAADAVALVLADGPPDLNLPIALGSDDAGPYPDYNCNYGESWQEIYLGRCYTGAEVVSGFRFSNVDIPQGAVISRAHIHFTVDGYLEIDPLLLRFYGDEDPNSPTFSPTNRPEDRSLTAAWRRWYIPGTDTWSWEPPPQPPQIRYSPNLASIAQEIVNDAEWQPGGSALTFIVKPQLGFSGTDHRRVMAYERPDAPPGTYAARLLVWFDE